MVSSKGKWWIAVIIFLVWVVLVNSDSSPYKDEETSTNSTTQTSSSISDPQSTRTPKPTNTPRPTKTPKPTVTAEPNFMGMPLEQSVSALVQYHCKGDFVCTDTTIINGGIAIDVKVESFFTEKTMVRDCCRLYMTIARSLFTNNYAQTLVINFDTPGRDKYGNEIMVRAMEIFLKRETAKKINYEYMIQNLGTSTDAFLRITDRYYVHNDLKKGVY